MLAKRGYKVRVMDQAVPTTTVPTIATKSTQMQTTGFATTAIPVKVHKHETGQFAKAPCATARPQNGGHPSIQNSPHLKDIPMAPVGQGIPWPNAGFNFREPV